MIETAAQLTTGSDTGATVCRTVEEARAAGRKAGAQGPLLSQEAADYIAAILASVRAG